jgi:hypothetical protein
MIRWTSKRSKGVGGVWGLVWKRKCVKDIEISQQESSEQTSVHLFECLGVSASESSRNCRFLLDWILNRLPICVRRRFTSLNRGRIAEINRPETVVRILGYPRKISNSDVGKNPWLPIEFVQNLRIVKTRTILPKPWNRGTIDHCHWFTGIRENNKRENGRVHRQSNSCKCPSDIWGIHHLFECFHQFRNLWYLKSPKQFDHNFSFLPVRDTKWHRVEQL